MGLPSWHELPHVNPWLGACRAEFIVLAVSLASAARAAQWRGGSLAKMREAG